MLAKKAVRSQTTMMIGDGASITYYSLPIEVLAKQ
jgi:hypothetical protein